MHITIHPPFPFESRSIGITGDDKFDTLEIFNF